MADHLDDLLRRAVAERATTAPEPRPFNALKQEQTPMKQEHTPTVPWSGRRQRNLLVAAVAVIVVAGIGLLAALRPNSGSDITTEPTSTSSTTTFQTTVQDEETEQTSTSSTTASTTATPASTTSTTEGDTAGPLRVQPEVIDRIISPSWVAELGDFEDFPSLIASVQTGGEAPEVSDAMGRIITAGLPDGQGLPYYYEAESAEGLVIAENVDLRLDNGDSLSVRWRFRWADTPPCEVCTENQVLWDNGWLVWTDTDPERGMIRLLAEHPSLPLNVEIWHFPDPLRWPEADPANDPILSTSLHESTAAAILDAVQTIISIPAG